MKKNKFYYIKKLSLKKSSFFSIPEYHELHGVQGIDFSSLLSGNESYILRSCLHNEGSDLHLRSGESLSFKGIKKTEEFTLFYEKVLAQKELEEAIIQKEINIDFHITGIRYQKENYLQITDKHEKANIQAMMNEVIYIGDIPQKERLLQAINEFSIEDFMIFELGIDSKGDIHLFQLNSISQKKSAPILEAGPLKEIFKNTQKHQGPLSFTKALSYLIQSFWHRYSPFPRSRNQEVIENWNFFMFFCALYLKREELKGEKKELEDYYQWITSSSHWMALSAMAHLKKANKASLSWNLHAGLVTQKKELIFIGKGLFEVREKGDILFLEELIPSEIQSLTRPKVIFTTDSRLLGHGYLMAMEKGHFIVGNIDTKQFRDLQDQGPLSIDFKNKNLFFKR